MRASSAYASGIASSRVGGRSIVCAEDLAPAAPKRAPDMAPAADTAPLRSPASEPLPGATVRRRGTVVVAPRRARAPAFSFEGVRPDDDEAPPPAPSPSLADWRFSGRGVRIPATTSSPCAFGSHSP